jgi:hypothetical protein
VEKWKRSSKKTEKQEANFNGDFCKKAKTETCECCIL